MNWWSPISPGEMSRRFFQETLEELAIAESGGIHAAWLVEHHFMREYPRCSAPALVLAATSQRTKTLRLGHAIIPLLYHQPLQVAECCVTLDILTNGHVEFGFGRGFSPREYAAFGVNKANSRGLVDEALAIIQQTFNGQTVNSTGGVPTEAVKESMHTLTKHIIPSFSH